MTYSTGGSTDEHILVRVHRYRLHDTLHSIERSVILYISVVLCTWPLCPCFSTLLRCRDDRNVHQHTGKQPLATGGSSLILIALSEMRGGTGLVGGTTTSSYVCTSVVRKMEDIHTVSYYNAAGERLGLRALQREHARATWICSVKSDLHPHIHVSSPVA